MATQSPHKLGLQDEAAKNLEKRRGTRGRVKMERAEAEAFIASKKAEAVSKGKPEEPTKKARVTRERKGWDITKEQIEDARDGKGLSWADVAKLLNLGNPGAARRAYTELTGRDHSTSVMTGRRARSGASSRSKLDLPTWDANSDRQEMVDRLTNATIVVKSSLYGDNGPTEELNVAHIRKFDDSDPERPAIEFIEGIYRKDAKSGEEYLDGKQSTGAIRTVFIDRIVEVR